MSNWNVLSRNSNDTKKLQHFLIVKKNSYETFGFDSNYDS